MILCNRPGWAFRVPGDVGVDGCTIEEADHYPRMTRIIGGIENRFIARRLASGKRQRLLSWTALYETPRNFVVESYPTRQAQLGSTSKPEDPYGPSAILPSSFPPLWLVSVGRRGSFASRQRLSPHTFRRSADTESRLRPAGPSGEDVCLVLWDRFRSFSSILR